MVGFHNGLSAKAPKTGARATRAHVLVCIDAENPLLPPEQRPEFEAKMRRAGVDWQMHLYGGTVHGFTNSETERRNAPNAIRYSPEAGARPWTVLLRQQPPGTLG